MSSELDAVEDRVVRVAPGIYLFREVPNPTTESVLRARDIIQRLAAGDVRYALVIDLTVATPPTPEVREALREMFSPPNLAYAAIFTGRNALMNVFARMVVSLVMGRRFGVFKSQAEAVDHAQDALRLGSAK